MFLDSSFQIRSITDILLCLVGYGSQNVNIEHEPSLFLFSLRSKSGLMRRSSKPFRARAKEHGPKWT